MNILNIDAFASPKRVLNIFGERHEVHDLDVQSYINNLKAAEALEKDGTGDNPLALVEHSVASICDAIPTLDAGKVRKLNIKQLGMVLQFIRGQLDDQAVPTPAEGEGGQGADAKS